MISLGLIATLVSYYARKTETISYSKGTLVSLLMQSQKIGLRRLLLVCRRKNKNHINSTVQLLMNPVKEIEGQN